MSQGDTSYYVYRGFDQNSGPIHIYVANGYDGALFKTARIKVNGYTITGFKINLYLSDSGGYALSRITITDQSFYPNTIASNVSGISYTRLYKRIA